MTLWLNKLRINRFKLALNCIKRWRHLIHVYYVDQKEDFLKKKKRKEIVSGHLLMDTFDLF